MLGEKPRLGEPDASFFSPTRRRASGRGVRLCGEPLSPALSPLVPRGERGSLASTAGHTFHAGSHSRLRILSSERGYVISRRLPQIPSGGNNVMVWLGQRSNVSSRICATAVAAEATRRNCFSPQNPPPYVSGYHSCTHPGKGANQ